jgi:Domain of unknown function (DUF5666)
MKRLACVALVLVCTSAFAQAPARVRGTITAVDGNTLTVDGKTPVRVAETTEIVFTQPIGLGEIKPGEFLAITSVKGADGKLTAYEVRRFLKPLNPGHRPFEGRDDQTMTNATVGSMVQTASGRELTMTYEGGAQKIVVPESAALFTLVPGNRAQLVRGAPISVTVDRDSTAIRLQVSPPK